ncbi:putative Gut-specific cysteine proteinase [Blattamonas nauphoetae]|uniref:Gut-specific cysteine proteinase n=1 Tax=Blattamonas nauphoetae TaxID=2049346 RepID=A0ABQ9XAV5_9EUKA|nr:putative Gut-specific cysteine proteinase [Blattamonas nauphoetae]
MQKVRSLEGSLRVVEQRNNAMRYYRPVRPSFEEKNTQRADLNSPTKGRSVSPPKENRQKVPALNLPSPPSQHFVDFDNAFLPDQPPILSNRLKTSLQHLLTYRQSDEYRQYLQLTSRYEDEGVLRIPIFVNLLLFIFLNVIISKLWEAHSFHFPVCFPLQMFSIFAIASLFAKSIVEIINSNPDSTWVAVEYPRNVINDAKIRAMLGVSVLNEGPTDYVPANDLPEEFDARVHWEGKMSPVRDQASCGSCWAFAVAETMTNRMAILDCSRGVMSPQDLVSCDFVDHGCNGGIPLASWEWVHLKGITTEECIPYSSGGGRVESCPKACKDGSAIVRTKATGVGHVKAANMQQELFDNGPFEVAFTVYEDFKVYKSGVYRHTTGSKLGGHAVMVMGWGVEDNTPYWLIQNSWGTVWGENGFFKIVRGQNECGIEATSYKGVPKCQ